MEWSSALQKLVSHNDDLRALLEKGYALAFDTNHLVVRDIPYLNESGEVAYGAFVIKLVFLDADRIAPANHIAYFAGSHPHEISGTRIPRLNGSPAAIQLAHSDDVVVERLLSTKPPS